MDHLQALAINDIFVNRVVPSQDSTLNQQIQVWILIANAEGQHVWEPAMVGRPMVFRGTERYLGVDQSSGKPYWYSLATFNKYLRGIRQST